MVNAADAVQRAVKTRTRPVEKVLSSSSESPLDLCFVVDTTGSMEDDIENAQMNMIDILAALSDKTSDYRVALVDYRDFSDRTGRSWDYPARTRLSFTASDDEIVRAIGSLDLGHGGDDAETVYSGLMEAAALPWRKNAGKVIIILGDAPPHDPEPVTGYTYGSVVAALREGGIKVAEDIEDYYASETEEPEAGSSISVYSIGTEPDEYAEAFFQAVSEDTGGSYAAVEEAEHVSGAVMESIEKIEVEPLVSVETDFGEDLGRREIGLYNEETWLFTFTTDEEGRFIIEDIPPGNYRWKCSALRLEGTLVISEVSGQAEIKVADSGEEPSGPERLLRSIMNIPELVHEIWKMLEGFPESVLQKIQNSGSLKKWPGRVCYYMAVRR